MSKKKMGRPKLPAKKSLQPGFSVRMVPEEAREVREAIKASGKGKSAWIREALLTAARRK